jgi:hypothetical protein
MYYKGAELQKQMDVLYIANLFAIATNGVSSQPSTLERYAVDTTSLLHTA